MKIQIDTKSKIIKIEETVNLGEMTEMLERLLPNGLWKEYKLETHTVINNWASPIYIDRYKPFTPYPIYPFWQVTNDIPCSISDVSTITTNQGTYCIEIGDN